jgi:hypothetical protein
MQNLKDNRGWFVTMLLSCITCGIYGMYLTHVMARDTNIACAKDGKHTRGLLAVILLSMVTLGIYGLVWTLKIISRWENNAIQAGQTPRCTLVSYLLWMLLGSMLCGIGSLIASYKYIHGFNQACAIYNAGAAAPAAPAANVTVNVNTDSTPQA